MQRSIAELHKSECTATNLSKIRTKPVLTRAFTLAYDKTDGGRSFTTNVKVRDQCVELVRKVTSIQLIRELLLIECDIRVNYLYLYELSVFLIVLRGKSPKPVLQHPQTAGHELQEQALFQCQQFDSDR